MQNFINIFYNQFFIVIPEIWLILSILFFFTICVFFYIEKKNNNKHIYFVNTLSIGVFIIMIVELFLLLNRLVLNIQANVFNFAFQVDFFSDFISFILALLVFLYFLVSFSYWKNEQVFTYEWVFLILLSYVGMHLIVHANDFVLLYVGIEMQSLPLYVLAGYSRFSMKSTEAALKYFILGALMSGLLLFGISTIYGVLGTINFQEIYYLINLIFLTNTFSFLDFYFVLVVLGFIFVLVALLFKLGVSPFHFWVPDVYHGVFSGVTVFFAVVPKIAILSILIKLFFYNNLLVLGQFSHIFLIGGVLSVIFGTIGAMYQVNIKRLLAFGAVNHLGFVIISLGLNDYFSVVASIFYLCIYLLLSLNFFSFYLNARVLYNIDFENIQTFLLLYKTQPVIAMQIICCFFSMAGIPPFSGFFSKLYVILNLVNNLEFLVAGVLIIMSVIAAVYYIRIIVLMKFHASKITNVVVLSNSVSWYIFVFTFLLQITGLVWLPYFMNILQYVILFN